MNLKEGTKAVVFTLFALLFVVLFALCIDVSDKQQISATDAEVPRIGTKLWMYNMNNRSWHNFKKTDYEMNKKGYIVLQVQQDPEMPDINSYHIRTENAQVSSSPLFLGEGSKEFLVGNKLYTFYPRSFEFSEVIFNGFNFTLNKLKPEIVSKLFKGYQIISISEFKNYNLKLKYSKFNNKYIILNDVGDNFYMYYVVPNNYKKMQLGEFANQFVVNGAVDIRLQRLEGCSKAYPCYEINIVK